MDCILVNLSIASLIDTLFRLSNFCYRLGLSSCYRYSRICLCMTARRCNASSLTLTPSPNPTNGWATPPSPTTSPFEPRRWPIRQIRGDIELFYTVKMVVSTINATLLIFLLISYVDIFRKTQSEFTIGLIIFSMTLLLYALFSNPLVQRIFGYIGFGLGPFAVLPDLFTSIALIVLLYLTLKY